MPIYTRTGDEGETRLPGLPPLSKNDARIEASGTIDELSAVLGMVRAEPLSEDIERLLRQIQQDLSTILAELATPDTAARGGDSLGLAQIRAIEEAIDSYQQTLEPIDEFVLPGGLRPAASLHLARTVCRRAERRLVGLLRQEKQEVSTNLTAYINRLGDLLFVLARTVNHQGGHHDERIFREKKEAE